MVRAWRMSGIAPPLARRPSPRLGGNCYSAGMSTTSRLLASGPGWQVSDIVCPAGPGDPVFEERHDHACIALVTEGSFQYRTAQGDAVLAPGAVLLGNEGACFECGHEHAAGDRCLAFQFAPEHLEEIVATVPGARRAGFALPRLPPLPALVPLLAAAEAASQEGESGELEELALRLAGAVAAALADGGRGARRPTARDERRIRAALRRIEAAAGAGPPPPALPREARLRPHPFPRPFPGPVGLT